MSVLVLVRHAQASFLEDDYDRLSSTGEKQARLLGQWWARQGTEFDQVFIGPRSRHARTAELAGEEVRKAGLPWPEPVRLEELDEYAAEAVMKRSVGELSQRHEHVRVLVERLAAATERPARARAFEKVFQAVTTMWVRGDFECPDVESFPQFCERIRDGFLRMTADQARGQHVVAFTSAGAIGASLQVALDVTRQRALELGWVIRNSALTEFLFTNERLSLSMFNAVPHLPDKAFWTYR